MPWHRPVNKGSCFSSIALPESRCSRSKSAAIQPSNIPGEVTAPTQPVPLLPEPFARQVLTEDLLTQRTPAAHAWAVQEFSTYLSAGQFIPTALDKETVVFPCFLGGAEWGGPAVDPRHGIIFINSNEWACVVAITENKPARSTGERTYHNQCSVCHNDDRKGSPPTYPSLVDVGQRLSPSQIESTILQGKGRMPAFPNLKGDYLESLVQFVTKGADANPKANSEKAEAAAAPFPLRRRRKAQSFRESLSGSVSMQVSARLATATIVRANRLRSRR